MITLKNVSKYYYNKGIIASGFTKINLTLHMGEFVAITGESGSGKSTLLNVISGLDTYEEGEMYINGKETSHYTEADFEAYRKKYISNIFQDFNLVNSYTVYENINLVLMLNGERGQKAEEKALNLIKEVGLTKYKNTKVSKLSGGQKQRVAIARALAKETPIIIADEPTGNLDTRSAKGVLELLHNVAKDKLVVIVTHNYEQVEPYITRKIKMHDGRILEDKVITQIDNITYKDNYKNLNLNIIDKIKIGIKNAFNIVPKFLLVLLVYLFIITAVTTEYSYFKKQEYETNSLGYNNYFYDIKDTRIIIKKNDNSPFSKEDYDDIYSINHVYNIIENDYLADSEVLVSDDENLYYNGIARDIDTFKGKLSIGNLPEKDNELLLVGNKDNYYLKEQKDKLVGSQVSIGLIDDIEQPKNYTITGIAYTNDTNGLISDGYIYGTSKMIEKLQFNINQNYSQLKVLFNNNYHEVNNYDQEYRIIASNKVPTGAVFITEDWNYECKNSNCIREKLIIEADNIYYKDKLELIVSNLYNKDNIEKLLGIKDFNQYNGSLFINEQDYNKLFNHPNYQSSVYVDDISNVDYVAKELEGLNLKTLKIKDTLYNGEIAEVLIIIRTIVTTILLIALFFISYFVIRIILKSRNTYFGTIRILGATKKDAKQLLVIELLTVSNIAYLIFMFIISLPQNNSNLSNTIIKYFTLNDYLLLYIILILMSYLISLRFSRKIFKSSAMNIMREEA